MTTSTPDHVTNSHYGESSDFKESSEGEEIIQTIKSEEKKYYQTCLKLTNDLKQIKEFDFKKWKSQRYEVVKCLEECADKMKKVSKNTGIVNIVGGGTGVIGSIISGIGIITLNPLVFGIGAFVSVGGGATTITGSIVNQVWSSKMTEKANQMTTKDAELTKQYLQLVEDLSISSNKYSKYAETMGSIGMTSASLGMGIKNMSLAINASKTLGQWGKLGVVVARDVNKALIFSERSIPIINKTIISTASTLSKAATSGLVLIGGAISIWDIVSGIKSIKNCKLEDKLRNTANELKQNMKIICKNHQKITAIN